MVPAFTAQTIAAAEHVKGHHHAKVVITKCAGKHIMTVLPADCQVDLEKLEKVAGMPVWIENEAEFYPNGRSTYVVGRTR